MIAKRLADGVDARVVLVVPKLESSSVPFDPASDEGAGLVDEYRALAASLGVHVTVLFCVCQRHDDVVHRMLGRSFLLVVGGRRRVWWPSREERLVSRLFVEGYPVVFAQVGAGRATGTYAGDGRLRTFLGTFWPLFRIHGPV